MLTYIKFYSTYFSLMIIKQMYMHTRIHTHTVKKIEIIMMNIIIRLIFLYNLMFIIVYIFAPRINKI